MSRTPFFFVEKFNLYTEKYELQHPIIWNYNHTKQEPADLFPYNGCHDLFSIVEENSDFSSMRGIHHGLPNDVSDEIKKAYNDCRYEIEYNNEKNLRTPTVRWFTYADMYIYCLEHPEVPDYEAMDELYYNEKEEDPSKKIMMPTPMNTLKRRVDAFLEVMNDWDWRDDYSLIRIIYWIM